MRRHGAIIALAAALALAHDAAAAEIRVTTPCVITSATSAPAVPIEGIGFTPGAELEVFTNGLLASVLDRPRADAVGAFSYELLTPVGEFGAEHPAPLTVTDTAGVSASTRSSWSTRASQFRAELAHGVPCGWSSRASRRARRYTCSLSAGDASAACAGSASPRDHAAR